MLRLFSVYLLRNSRCMLLLFSVYIPWNSESCGYSVFTYCAIHAVCSGYSVFTFRKIHAVCCRYSVFTYHASCNVPHISLPCTRNSVTFPAFSALQYAQSPPQANTFFCNFFPFISSHPQKIFNLHHSTYLQKDSLFGAKRS